MLAVLHKQFTRSLKPRCSRLSSAYASTQKWKTHGHPAPLSLLDDSSGPLDLSEDSEIVDGARPGTLPLHRRVPSGKPTPSEYAAHRRIMKETFPEGWSPPRKLSREAMEGLREMHQLSPETFTTPILAEKFRISPEAVRRILKSKWVPTRDQRVKFAEREKLRRAEYIQSLRTRERQEAEEISKTNRDSTIPGQRSNTTRERRAYDKDKLYFQ